MSYLQIIKTLYGVLSEHKVLYTFPPTGYVQVMQATGKTRNPGFPSKIPGTILFTFWAHQSPIDVIQYFCTARHIMVFEPGESPWFDANNGDVQRVSPTKQANNGLEFKYGTPYMYCLSS